LSANRQQFETPDPEAAVYAVLAANAKRLKVVPKPPVYGEEVRVCKLRVGLIARRTWRKCPISGQARDFGLEINAVRHQLARLREKGLIVPWVGHGCRDYAGDQHLSLPLGETTPYRLPMLNGDRA
jgi:DNA-binding transcriptional ArsR family regulator